MRDHRRMSRAYAFDDQWTFEAPIDRVWAHVLDVGSFTEWWPGLDRLDVERMEPGQSGMVTVRSPVGFSLHFEMHVTEVDPFRRVSALVEGDLEGDGSLELIDRWDATDVRLGFNVDLRQRALKPIGGPLYRWGHEALISRWVRRFRQVLREPLP